MAPEKKARRRLRAFCFSVSQRAPKGSLLLSFKPLGTQRLYSWAAPVENRAAKTFFGGPKSRRDGKAVALYKDAFLTGEPSNDETTRIQKNQEGAVTNGDHL